MFFKNKILLLFAVAAFLSGCTQKNEAPISLKSSQSFSTEDSQVSSVSESSISESESSESQSESSSDDKVYYTVSIYQSYPKRPDALGRKDTRLDRTFKTEAGKPLYTSDEERRALADTFKPQFTPYGGMYHLTLLFLDEKCTVFYREEPILSDSIFYYFMEG